MKIIWMTAILGLIPFLGEGKSIIDSLSFQEQQKLQFVIKVDSIDSISKQSLTDTLNILIENKDKNWFKRNEGTFLGSFCAATIALISILLTNYYNKKSKQRLLQKGLFEKQNIYCSLLYAVYNELLWHKNLSEIIKKELNEIQRISLEKGKLIVDSPSEKFNTEYLHQFRIKILEFHKFNTDLLAYISTYLNLLSSINYSLDFKKVKDFYNHFVDESSYNKALKAYFADLFDLFVKVGKGIQRLQDMIKEELVSFPQNKIVI